MTRRARFTQSEMDRLFSAAKKTGMRVRIIPTRESITIETIEPEQGLAGTTHNLPIAATKDIVL